MDTTKLYFDPNSTNTSKILGYQMQFQDITEKSGFRMYDSFAELAADVDCPSYIIKHCHENALMNANSAYEYMKNQRKNEPRPGCPGIYETNYKFDDETRTVSFDDVEVFGYIEVPSDEMQRIMNKIVLLTGLVYTYLPDINAFGFIDADNR